MPSRGQTITAIYTAWDNAANAPKTGDVANHTLRWIKDGTAAAPTNTPTEVDATNAPGEYKLVLTAAEATCHFGTLAGKSSTADVVLIPTRVAFENLPTAATGDPTGLPFTSTVTDVGDAVADALAALADLGDGTTKVTPIDVDGITFASAMEVLLAVMSGITNPVGTTMEFMKRDGSTVKITIQYGSGDGERVDSVIA